MSIVSAKCPNCGGEIQLDDAKEIGFCMFCGNKVMVNDPTKIKVSGSVKIDSSDTLKNYLNLANQAFLSFNYMEAYTYYTKVLELNSNEYHSIYRKALCAGFLSNSKNSRIDELINGFKKAYELIGKDYEKRVKISEELVNFALKIFPSQNILNINNKFQNEQDCESYVNSLYNAIVILDKINYLVTVETENIKKQLLIHLITLCDGLINNGKFSYRDGVQYDKTGATTPKYSTYIINENIKNKVLSIRKTAVNCHNNLPSNQNGISRIQTEVDEYRKKIKQYDSNVAKHWKEHIKEYRIYMLAKYASLILGVMFCFNIYTIIPGIILLLSRKFILKKLESNSFSPELQAEKEQNKLNLKNLKLKEDELNKYKQSTLIK